MRVITELRSLCPTYRLLLTHMQEDSSMPLPISLPKPNPKQPKAYSFGRHFSSLANMALDYIFIKFAKLGIFGAGLATVIGFSIGGGVALIYFIFSTLLEDIFHLTISFSSKIITDYGSNTHSKSQKYRQEYKIRIHHSRIRRYSFFTHNFKQLNCMDYGYIMVGGSVLFMLQCTFQSFFPVAAKPQLGLILS